jgi:hypothetical protein
LAGLYDDLDMKQMAEDAIMHGMGTVSSVILELERSIEDDHRYLKRRANRKRRDGQSTRADDTNKRIARVALAKALAAQLLRKNLLTLERMPHMFPVEKEAL